MLLKVSAEIATSIFLFAFFTGDLLIGFNKLC
jgi:hypothetical protein